MGLGGNRVTGVGMRAGCGPALAALIFFLPMSADAAPAEREGPAEPAPATLSRHASTLGAAAPVRVAQAGPAAAETDRTIFGEDERRQVTDTRSPPYRMVGLVQALSASGAVNGCSGTLIGPRTVLTAAHCLYDHEDGGWYEDILFAPGLISMSDIPHGVFRFDAVHILEGFVTEWRGDFSSVVRWDLGLVILEEAIGEHLGWMGFEHVARIADFEARILGYPGDKDPGTLWHSACTIGAGNVGEQLILHRCDTFAGMSGGPVFVDYGVGEYVVRAVNVGESPMANAAVRLNRAYSDWVVQHWR